MRKIYTCFKPVLAIILLCNSNLFAQTTTYTGTGTITSYTVPSGVSRMSITAKGAQGGLSLSYTGGTGAIMTGTFNVTPGHVLKILVGKQSSSSSHYTGGGGGGSFVWDVTAGNILLVAAGGGGGGGYSANGVNAVITADGTNGGGGATYGGAGTAGSGATTPTYTRYGGGGTGWLSNGAAGLWSGCSNAGGGQAPLSGGVGGAYGGNVTYVGPGGFGGGGGGQGNCTAGFGGGGGGYSGGGAGAGPTDYGGGGGGSFNGGAPQANSVGNTGDGVVTMTRLCAPPTGGVIIGPDSVCVGAVVTLSDPSATIPGTFGTGTWSSGTPSIATVDPVTGAVAGNVAGVDTIYYTIALTCGSVTTSRYIAVKPLPAPILGFSDVCPGSHTILTDATPGGKWTSVATSVATIDSVTGNVSGTTVGISTISYTLASTGCASTRVVNVASMSGATHVCDGDTIEMTSTSVTPGTWSTSDSSLATVNSTGVVTGIGYGTVTIAYTLPCGCTLSRLVTVNPLAPIEGIDSVCIGSSRYLTDIVGGGVWTSGTPAVATITSDSGRVFGATVGTTNITYALPGTACKSYATFHVIDFPPGILGSTQACPGTTTTLVDAIGGGWWTSGNTSVATVNGSTGVVTGLAVDTVDIYYTISPGCKIGIEVTINPLPAPITGINIICPGTTDSLADVSPYGSWTTTTGSITKVDTLGVVTGISGGDGIIRYTLPVTGCYQTKIVTVDPLPVPVLTYNYLAAALYATTGYMSYQWYDSTSGKINGATSPSVGVSNTDYYYVVVTDSNGCKGVSAAYHYDVNQVGINNVATANGVTIYPNPATGIVYINAPVKVRAVITSLDGRIEMAQDDAKEINIGHLANGLYFISVYDESGAKITIQKLVKE